MGNLFRELRHVSGTLFSQLQSQFACPASCRMTSEPPISSVTVRAERLLVKRRVYRWPHHTRLADVFLRAAVHQRHIHMHGTAHSQDCRPSFVVISAETQFTVYCCNRNRVFTDHSGEPGRAIAWLCESVCVCVPMCVCVCVCVSEQQSSNARRETKGRFFSLRWNNRPYYWPS